jgi:outer membrane murein-binding lipoprotein Lpp
LRVQGIRSVEEVASLTDVHIQQFKIHNLRSIIEAAKRFVDGADVNKFAGEIKAKDEQLAAANARIDQMAEMLAKLMEDKETPKRGPGRPPKEQAVA